MRCTKYVCPVCTMYPGSHSFTLVNVKNDGTHVFYTCPANASLYRDEDGIAAHYEGFLSEIGDAPWEWVVDFAGFTLIHATAPHVAIRVARLIMNDYSRHLKKITIINENTCFDIMFNIVRPFISKKIEELICIHGKLETNIKV